MENASKALIIAGAILIAILLIGIGVGLISAVSDPAAQGTDEIVQAGIKAANAKFEKYQGKQTGSNIISLIKEIRIHNSSNTTGNVIKYKTVGWKKADLSTSAGNFQNADNKPLDKLNEAESAVVKNHTYTVSFAYEASTAKISLITITW